MPEVAKQPPQVAQSGTRIRSVPLTGTDPETRYQAAPISFVRRLVEQIRIAVQGQRNLRRYRNTGEHDVVVHRDARNPVSVSTIAGAGEITRKRDTRKGKTDRHR
jgi:hypothetical protein